MKKLNNKGVTLIELIASFAIVSVAVIYLYQTLFIVSKLYTDSKNATNNYIDVDYAFRIIDELTSDSIANGDNVDSLRSNIIAYANKDKNFKLDIDKNSVIIAEDSSYVSFSINNNSYTLNKYVLREKLKDKDINTVLSTMNPIINNIKSSIATSAPADILSKISERSGSADIFQKINDINSDSDLLYNNIWIPTKGIANDARIILQYSAGTRTDSAKTIEINIDINGNITQKEYDKLTFKDDAAAVALKHSAGLTSTYEIILFKLNDINYIYYLYIYN